MNGLSSGALQRTTSFVHPKESLSFVKTAVSLITSPISFTASILIPVLVEPRFTDDIIRSVWDRAIGMERIKSSSAGVIPFATNAEYPPIKFTPTSLATRSKVFAISTKSSFVLHAAPPIRPIGVTEIRLFTIGIPNSLEISSPVLTRSLAAS